MPDILPSLSVQSETDPPAYILRIAAAPIEIAPKHIVSAITYNGQFPGPLLRFKEGQSVTVDVHNDTDNPEQLLLQRGTVSKEDLIAALSEVTTVPYVDCTTVEVPTEALRAIPAAMARRCNMLPIKLEGNKLTVAMAEPQNLQVIDELR